MLWIFEISDKNAYNDDLINTKNQKNQIFEKKVKSCINTI